MAELCGKYQVDVHEKDAVPASANVLILRHKTKYTRSMAKRKIKKGDDAKANTARKYLLVLSPENSGRMTSWGHTRRAIKNLALAQRQLLWDGRGIRLRAKGQSQSLTEARADFDWMADLPAQAAQAAIKDLDLAYDNWWNPDHPAGPPTFEKRSSKLRFSLPGQAVDVRHIDRKWSEVWIPKLGWQRFRRHRPFNGVVRNATFTFTPGSGWMVSFGIAAKQITAPPNGKPATGVDFGVACSAFLSDEEMTATLTPGEKRRLVGLERRKARQLTWAKRHNNGRYSNRLRHTNSEIARLRAKQARRRNDFTHKLTTDVAKNHGIVGIEDLRVKNMTASAKGTVEAPGTSVAAKAGLNRGILDNAPFERRRQFGYKGPKFGTQIVSVPAPNTSRRCAKCKALDPANRPGCGREFACVACGHQDHADRNAAVNIRAAAEQIYAAQTAGPADNSTGRRKPSQSRKAEGGSVKRVAPVGSSISDSAGRVESRVA